MMLILNVSLTHAATSRGSVASPTPLQNALKVTYDSSDVFNNYYTFTLSEDAVVMFQMEENTEISFYDTVLNEYNPPDASCSFIKNTSISQSFSCDFESGTYIVDLGVHLSFKTGIPAFSIFSSALISSSSTSSEGSYTQADLNAQYEAGIAYCQSDPSACGISTDGSSSSWTSTTSSSIVVNELQGKSHDVNGHYINYGDAAFDWIYVDSAGKSISKLEEGCTETGGLRWTTIHTSNNENFSHIIISDDGKSVAIGGVNPGTF